MLSEWLKTAIPPNADRTFYWFIMGKKSRKIKARTPIVGSGASNADVVSGPQPACYFCLEEGDDEEAFAAFAEKE